MPYVCMSKHTLYTGQRVVVVVARGGRKKSDFDLGALRLKVSVNRPRRSYQPEARPRRENEDLENLIKIACSMPEATRVMLGMQN